MEYEAWVFNIYIFAGAIQENDGSINSNDHKHSHIYASEDAD